MKSKLLILFLFIWVGSLGQSVPNTETFTLQNVIDVVSPTTNDLQESFNDAVPSYFDPTYNTDTYAPANSLLRFRNYADNGVIVGNTFPLLNTSAFPTDVYSYDPVAKTSTLLPLSGQTSSLDIAHTLNKLWIPEGDQYIGEWDILSLSPFSASKVRTIDVSPLTSSTGSGLCAKDDNTLIIMIGWDVYEVDVSVTPITYTFKFSALPRGVNGDYILTNGKLIVLHGTAGVGGDKYITQYDYATGAVEVDIYTSALSYLYGIFEYNSGLYICNYGTIYNVGLSYPYSITHYDTESITVYGASQAPSVISATLQPSPNPLAVSTTTATNITDNSATAGGNVTHDGGIAVTTRGVQYSLSSNFSVIEGTVSSGRGEGSFTAELTGLSSSTLYYYRAYATNAEGTVYGSTLSFTTDAGIALATLTTTSVSNVTYSSAQSGGTFISDGGGTITAKGVRWSLYSDYSVVEDSTNDGSGATSFTSQMTGLTPSTTYYYQSYAINEAGMGVGTPRSFTTASSPTPEVSAATPLVEPPATTLQAVNWNIALDVPAPLGGITVNVTYTNTTGSGSDINSTIHVAAGEITGVKIVTYDRLPPGDGNYTAVFTVVSGTGYTVDMTAYQEGVVILDQD